MEEYIKDPAFMPGAMVKILLSVHEDVYRAVYERSWTVGVFCADWVTALVISARDTKGLSPFRDGDVDLLILVDGKLVETTVFSRLDGGKTWILM